MNSKYGKLIINVTKFLINYVVRFIFAGIVLYCSWVPLQDLYDWFSYHVIFCTIGFMPLIAEGIMLFAGDDLWSRQLNRKTKCKIHGVLVTIGTVFVILGNLPGMYSVNPGYHLYTVHGIAGLVSMIILTLSIILGLATNYSDEMRRLISIETVWHKFVHNFEGLLGYAIGITSLCLAYYTDWFIRNNGDVSRWSSLVLTILAALWSVNTAIKSLCHQIKDIFL